MDRESDGLVVLEREREPLMVADVLRDRDAVRDAVGVAEIEPVEV